MPKLIAALWLTTLFGACRTTPPSAASSNASTEACESPEQAGCAECCVAQLGPAPGEQTCYRRRAVGRDYAEQADHLNQGPCPTTCRPCAACTRDRKKSYEQLRARACDCSDPFVRDVVNSIDPCYSDGCGCTCGQLARMSECGPPF